MSKIIRIMLIILLASSLISCTNKKNASDKPIVYTSFYPVYSLTKSVVGDTVDLRMFLPKNQDPHLWEPTPKRIKDLSEADLLIINGANLEHWSDSISKTLPNLDILNLASGVNLISYKGAAAIGDFQYMVKGNFSTETYSFDFGHTHEDNMRIAFLYYDKDYSDKELIKIGRKLMEEPGEDIPQKDLINVVDRQVYKLEMGHEHGEIYYKLPKKGEWIMYSDRISSDLLSYRLLDSHGEKLDLKVLRDTSTTNEDKITYDPHSWMSIRNAKRYVNDIEYKMSKMYPENEKIYRKNASKTLRELTELDYKYRDLFKNTKKKEFIVSHFAFAYLAKDFDLIQYPLQGLTSADSPSIKKLIKVIEDSKARNINTIFYEYGMPKNGADIIAQEINADLKGLISMEYVGTYVEKHIGKDFIDMMEYNLKTIYDSLRWFMKAIEIKNANFSYDSDFILKGLNLTVNNKEKIAIIGGNGVGKTTLIKIIVGELKLNLGSIKIFEEDLNTSSLKRIGYVPQSQKENLYTFPITVKELVTLQLYDSLGKFKIPKREHYNKTMNLLKKMNLEKYANYPIKELSGGLRQRVVITRALMNNPDILIFDEPTSGVDESSKIQFAKTIEELNKKFDVSIILITHELDWIKNNLKLDSIYELKNGGLLNVAI